MNMRMMLLGGALLATAACSNQETSNPTVSGTIENAEGQTLALLKHASATPDTIASAVLDASGQFSFEVPAGRLSFYTLGVGEFPPLFLVFDSTETLVVNADTRTIHTTYEVSGSEDSEDIRNFFLEGTQYEQQMDSLMQALQKAATSGDQIVRSGLGNEYNAVRKAYRTYLEDHIRNNPSSAANYTVLQRLDPVKDIELFQLVRDSLQPRLAGNYFFDVLAERVAQSERKLLAASALDPGNVAPEISLPNPDGEMLPLSSLRGKYVLIDFWASWCKPCRLENPNVVKLYNRYKDKGFEVYGVSLDKDRQKWIKAIEEDKLTWSHVSDLQFWNSAAAQLYNVNSIPFTVLIDPEGKVVQTKLRGRALEQKLEALLGA